MDYLSKHINIFYQVIINEFLNY